MTVNGNQLASRVNNAITSILRLHGFTRKGSKWWKRTEKVTFLVVRRGLSNPHSIDRLDTFSFCIVLAACLRCMPDRRIRAWEEFVPRDEADCHLTRELSDTTGSNEFLNIYPDGLATHIWSVSEAGTNLEDVIADVKNAVNTVALPWFDFMTDLEQVFEKVEIGDNAAFGPLALGKNGSVWHCLLLAYLALELGRKSEAFTYFENLMDLYNKPPTDRLLDLKVVEDFESLKLELGK